VLVLGALLPFSVKTGGTFGIVFLSNILEFSRDAVSTGKFSTDDIERNVTETTMPFHEAAELRRQMLEYICFLGDASAEMSFRGGTMAA